MSSWCKTVLRKGWILKSNASQIRVVHFLPHSINLKSVFDPQETLFFQSLFFNPITGSLHKLVSYCTTYNFLLSFLLLLSWDTVPRKVFKFCPCFSIWLWCWMFWSCSFLFSLFSSLIFSWRIWIYVCSNTSTNGRNRLK